MKAFNKQEIEYKNGYLMHGNEIVCVDNEIVDLMNKLEEDAQKADYIDKQDKPVPVDLELDNFERKSEHNMPFVVPNTPEMDRKVEESLKLMDDIDSTATAALCNEYLASISPIVQFVQDDFVISQENQGTQHRFDLPMIGNPCKLTIDSLLDIVIGLFD